MPDPDIKIIGAGLGRTGTLSLFTALNQLGYTCFHMKTLLKGVMETGSELQMEHWVNAKNAKDAGEDELCKSYLRKAVHGYDALMDLPACNFYKELHEMYPKALVLLSVRTRPEDWSKSVMSSISRLTMLVNHPFLNYFISFAALPSLFVPLTKGFLATPDNNMIYPSDWMNAKFLENHYVAHNQKVRDYFKDLQKKGQPHSDVFIEYSVKQGWPPITDKLGISPPKHAFPHTNDAAAQQDGVKKMRIILILPPILFTIAIILACLGYHSTAVMILLLPFFLKIIFKQFVIPKVMKRMSADVSGAEAAKNKAL